MRKWIVDDLEALVGVLPRRVIERLREQAEPTGLLEVVLDLGRPPLARFPGRDVVLAGWEVSEEDLGHVRERVGAFGDDNRAGIQRTLHRISAIRKRDGKILGLTCRVGRAVYGTIRVIEDLVPTGRSLLLLGRPGVGKTTMLREVARVLADDFGKRVMIVDTSNEIAGDGDIPHPSIGRARRMQVPTPDQQHRVMIEAVENHMPEVIIIDEMGTQLEAAAARTIAERGVQLVATAHGNTLDNLVMNPTLADLVGGIQSVTLGDEEARRRGTRKSVLERKAPPTFDTVVEIQNWDDVVVHAELAGTVDAMLRGIPLRPERRWIDEEGDVQRSVGEGTAARLREPGRAGAPGVPHAGDDAAPRDARGTAAGEAQAGALRQAVRQARDTAADSGRERVPRVYAFGVGRDKLGQAARATRSPVAVAERLEEADVVLTTKAHYRRRGQVLGQAEARRKPVFVLRRNSTPQLERFLLNLYESMGDNGVDEALQEAERAVARVREGAAEVELRPQAAYIRRLQHRLATDNRLRSRSNGQEPFRRVAISGLEGAEP